MHNIFALMAGGGGILVAVSSSLDNCGATVSSLYPESCDDISDFSPDSNETELSDVLASTSTTLMSVSMTLTSVFSTLLNLALDLLSLEFFNARFLLGLGLSGSQPLRS